MKNPEENQRTWKSLQKQLTKTFQVRMIEREVPAAEMCEQAGISEALWGDYCICRLPMRIEDLTAIAAALDLKVKLNLYTPANNQYTPI